MKISPKLVQASNDDRAFFVEAHHRAYRETIELLFEWDQGVQDAIANRKFDKGGIHLILDTDRKAGVVGWEFHAKHLLLKEFFILPEIQNRGLGGAILEHVKRLGRDRGLGLKLRTLSVNLRAQAFYQRHGFGVKAQTSTHVEMVFAPLA